MFVATADHVEEDVGGAAIAGQVAELVEDQERWSGVPLEPALEGGKRFLLEEIGERGGQRGEADGLAGEQGGVAEVLREHGLAHAGLAAQEHVLATADEVEGGEAFDELAVDLARVCPVEAVERLEGAEVGGAGAAREVGGLPGAALERDERLDGLGGAEVVVVRVGQEGCQGVAPGAKPELGKLS